ncbi:MAG TPA: class I SAM-dependent methyltransferase [Vicinamibacterales bacterium]|nr:class I SAM-dependent methyltransferase [Vicinamibacterales bacterium]
MSLQGWLQERQYDTPYHWHQRHNDEREYQLRTESVLDLAGVRRVQKDPAYTSHDVAPSNTSDVAPSNTSDVTPSNVGRVLSDPPLHLLDIGCGDGRFTADATRVARVVGTDVSRRALAHARSLVADARFVNAGGAALPFQSDSFDVVTLLDVIEHIPDDDEGRVIAEARRVLRPGGRLVISTNTDRSACELKHYRHYSLTRFRSLFRGLTGLQLRGLIPYFPTLRVWMATPLVSRLVESRIRVCSPELAHVIVGAATKP